MRAMDGSPESMAQAIGYVSKGKIVLLPLRPDFWQDANKSASP